MDYNEIIISHTFLIPYSFESSCKKVKAWKRHHSLEEAYTKFCVLYKVKKEDTLLKNFPRDQGQMFPFRKRSLTALWVVEREFSPMKGKSPVSLTWKIPSDLWCKNPFPKDAKGPNMFCLVHIMASLFLIVVHKVFLKKNWISFFYHNFYHWCKTRPTHSLQIGCLDF